MSAWNKIWLGVAMVSLVIGYAAGVLTSRESGVLSENNNSLGEVVAESCEVKKERMLVRGDSLTGIIEEGEEIEVEKGYYRCLGEKPQREEIVVYKLSGRPDPIIKQVRAVPGDIFELRRLGQEERWQIVVNGEVLKTKAGEEYRIGLASWKILSLYENDFRGVVPEGSYLILGSLPFGSLDSTRFGLVSPIDMIGRVVR